MTKNQKNQPIQQVTRKAPYVENQLTMYQKSTLTLLTKRFFPEVQKFTMTTHLNVIVTEKDGSKILHGHWFLFCIKGLLPIIVGTKYSNTASVLQKVTSGENIIDVLQQYANTLPMRNEQ